MLLCLSRLGLLGRDETGGQGVELMVRLLELPVHQADARNERGDVGAGRLGRPGGDLDGRGAQHGEHMGGVDAADAVALEKLGELESDGYRNLAKRRLSRLLERNRRIDSVPRLDMFGNGLEDLPFEYVKQRPV